MGKRLTKIYTKTGDNGTTGLSDGSRVGKDHSRINVIGTIDELNSVIGLVISTLSDKTTQELLSKIQHKLFNIGGELSLPGHSLLEDSDTTWLEEQLDSLNSELQPLKDFILPGGCQAAACCHVARSVCRRAERELVTLNNEEEVSPHIMRYINRLSDLLFVLARFINKQENVEDILWQTDK